MGDEVVPWVGESVGMSVGGSVGGSVGDHVGGSVGDSVGAEVGSAVGEFVGCIVGLPVGSSVAHLSSFGPQHPQDTTPPMLPGSDSHLVTSMPSSLPVSTQIAVPPVRH